MHRRDGLPCAAREIERKGLDDHCFEEAKPSECFRTPPLADDHGWDGDAPPGAERVAEEVGHPLASPLQRDQGAGVERDLPHAVRRRLARVGRAAT